VSLPPRLLAGLAAVLLLTSACWSGDAANRDMLEPQTYGDLPAEIDYVALGDSYSAGPLVTTIRSDPSGCVRSTDNYPAFLAGWLSVDTYTDVTCSAADTSDLTGQQRLVDGKRVAPQLEALSDDTDLVTLGIGGNDFSIFSSLIDCVEACSDEVQALLLKNAGRVEGRVADAVREITDRAPAAEVFVVGYPHVLPETQTCRAVPLPESRLRTATRIAERLNASLRAGAESAGASYVDVEPASEGHDVCAGKAAWINGPQFRLGIAAPFHPMLAGMRGVATEVFATITGEDAPATERAAPPRDAVVRNIVPG
jgi:lysophospholipase L1-like esterase